MNEYEWAVYGEVRVAFTRDLDGGGTTFGQTFVPFVRENIGPVPDALEWCAGPGFIGFSLLANGLCGSLALADKNPDAIHAARTTVRANGLESRVRVYESDCLAGVPADVSWDLVVANPPHAATAELGTTIPWPSIISTDAGWSAHKRFYRDVTAFLRPRGSVLLLENSAYSRPESFESMIRGAGLEWIGAFPAVGEFYFVWSRSPQFGATPGAAPPVRGRAIEL